MNRFLTHFMCLIIVVLCNNATINKVIVPMAGLGTRLLPLTKSCPKSMVALVDKPALHHVVEEALQSSLNKFYFIVNKDEQESIQYYFTHDTKLDFVLAEKNKTHLLEPLNNLISQAYFNYVIQPEPLGSGHAVLMAESYIDPGEFFGVMYPDNIIESTDPHMAQLIAIAQHYNASVITVEEMPSAYALQYGIITPQEFLTDNVIEISDIVEKPQSWPTEFCLAQMGRHVFSYDIFESLKAIESAANGEIQLTDAVKHMLQRGKRVLAYKLQGRCYDTGNIKGLLETTISLALNHPEYRNIAYSVFEREIKYKRWRGELFF